MGDIFINIFKIATKYGHLFAKGALVTLEISAIAVLLGTILGSLVAIMKMAKSKPVSAIATVYIEVLRGTPMLVQLYFFYFMLPMIFPALNGSAMLCICIAVTLNSAAYMAEVIRSGIQAVDKGQTEASRSLGLSGRQTMMKIVLPQAIKNILPAMCNEFVTIIKETAIVSTFFGGDIMTAFKTVQGITYLAIEPLMIAAFTYFILTFVLSKIIAVFERRLKASD